MITEKMVTERLVLRSKSQKKISKYQEGLEDIMEMIFYINSLDEFTDWVWEHTSLNEVVVPEELSQFIMPLSVRVNPTDRKTRNLLDKSYLSKFSNVPTKERYYNALDSYRANFKADGNSNLVAVSSVRSAVALFDILDKAAVGDNVKVAQNPFIPIKVNGIQDLFEDRYFNDSIDGAVNDFIDQLRFSK